VQRALLSWLNTTVHSYTADMLLIGFTFQTVNLLAVLITYIPLLAASADSSRTDTSQLSVGSIVH